MTTVLKGGRVITAAGDVYEDGVVVVKSGVITAVGNAADTETPAAAEVVDASGQTVMPGLIDAHLHLSGSRSMDFEREMWEPNERRLGRALKYLDQFIEAGYTTVRDIGSTTGVHLKALMAEGLYSGPHIVTSHKVITQTGGHSDFQTVPLDKQPDFHGILADGEIECRKAARGVLREGADFIKICSSGGVLSPADDPRAPHFTVDEIKVFVYEAGAAGTYVASHAHSAQGIKNALVAGVRTIEHGTLLDQECLDLFLEHDAYLVPTLSIVERLLEHGDEELPAPLMDKLRMVAASHKQNVSRALEAGVKIAAGTDFGGTFPTAHGENALELKLLHETGMTPVQAIEAATRVAAEAMDLRNVGTLAAGNRADLIVVDGNPLDNLDVLLDTARIKRVMVEGQWLKG